MEIVPGTTVTNRIGAKNNYGFATMGAVAKYGVFNATALHHTDGVNQLGVGIQQEKDNLTFNIRANRFETKQGGSNMYTASVVLNF